MRCAGYDSSDDEDTTAQTSSSGSGKTGAGGSQKLNRRSRTKEWRAELQKLQDSVNEVRRLPVTCHAFVPRCAHPALSTVAMRFQRFGNVLQRMQSMEYAVRELETKVSTWHVRWHNNALVCGLVQRARVLWIFTWQQRKSAAAAAAGAAASRYVHASDTIAAAASSSADTADLELRLALLERRLALLGNNEVSDAPLSLTGGTVEEEDDGDGTLTDDAAHDERERHFNALFDFLEVSQL